MELVTIKNKFQIVIPRTIRERAHLDVGDLLAAGIENGKITFTPKSVIDRHLAEGLKDLAEGRTHGPYKTADEAIAALEARAARKPRSSRKRR
jgi:AbrB family looped-hinge helix DNA binding protein